MTVLTYAALSTIIESGFLLERLNGIGDWARLIDGNCIYDI